LTLPFRSSSMLESKGTSLVELESIATFVFIYCAGYYCTLEFRHVK
jgi:hypothetical protein